MDLTHLKDLQKQQRELTDQLGKSLIIQSYFPNIYKNNESVKLSHSGMWDVKQSKECVLKAYFKTAEGVIPVPKELYTKLTGKTNFHTNYNKNFIKNTDSFANNYNVLKGLF